MIRPQSIATNQQALVATDKPAQKPQRRPSAGVGLAISILLLALGWKALVVLRDYPAFVLPAPEVVLGRLVSELSTGSLRGHAAITLAEALGGFALALAVSLPLAYLLAHSPRLERLLAPQLA
ncbi:MAG TPA: ABC transporter permease, partial [Roseiflexaceae bacterium]|nr:ABC transporter permease [Roseiflexaceae bacterium]